jgi:hypothetical protein
MERCCLKKHSCYGRSGLWHEFYFNPKFVERQNAWCGQVVEPKTGMTFPGVLNKCQLLTGTGLRTKSILGLKKITVYTFGNFLPLMSFTADVRILLCPVYLLHSFHIIF